MHSPKALRCAFLACVATLTGVGSATPQNVAQYWNPPAFHWEPWEVQASVPKSEIIGALDTCLRPPHDTASYHLVDVDGDAVSDAVYEGPNLLCDGTRLEGVRTRIFMSRPGGSALVFDTLGTITGMTRPLPWTPIHFTFHTKGCCGDFRTITRSYVPMGEGDTLRFAASTTTVGYGLMEVPSVWFPEAFAFTVQNETYNLRYAPIIDNTVNPGEPADWRLGNVLAQYAVGARGLALAEQADETGRIWWFVLMQGSPEPTWVSIDARVGGRLGTVQRLGWMSSRYLARLEAVPVPRP